MKPPSSLPLPPPRLWSRQEYEHAIELGLFGPGERLELIEGVIVQKMPQGGPHAVSTGLAEEALRRAFSTTGTHVRVQMPMALGDRNEPEPDLAVVSGHRRDYVASHPADAILVVEVSDTTLPYDRSAKSNLYAAARIPEYWIVNLVDRVLEVHREPVAVPEQPLGFHYRNVTRHAPGTSISPLAVPEEILRVEDLLP